MHCGLSPPLLRKERGTSPPPMDQNPADLSREERPSQGPGSRRPTPAVVALVLIGIVLVLSIGAFALVTNWLG